MAPKRLRKIENQQNFNSLYDFAEAKETKNSAWKRFRFIAILMLVFVAFVTLVYLYFDVPDGLVIVRSRSFMVKSPSDGYLQWTINKHWQKVKQGQCVAKLAVDRFSQLGLSSKMLEQNMANIEALRMLSMLNSEENSMNKNILDTQLQLQRARHDASIAKNRLDKAERIFNVRIEEKKRAERMWNLDAISKSDINAAQRMYASSETDYKNSKHEYQNAEIKLQSVKQKLDLYNADLKTRIANSEKTRKMLEKYIVSISKAGADMEKKLEKGVYTIDLHSPVDGLIVYRYHAVGEFVNKGDDIMSVAPPGEIRVFAYVNVKYKSTLIPGKMVKIKVDDHTFSARIKYVKPEVVTPPQRFIQNRMVSGMDYILVEFDTLNNAPDDLMPGQTGKVIF